jgi:hypothetical protein
VLKTLETFLRQEVIMSNPAREEFETFHLYTDQTLDSPFIKRFVKRMKFCINLEQPEEETRQDYYLDECGAEAVCLVHADDTHRILLHCGTSTMYTRYRKRSGKETTSIPL